MSESTDQTEEQQAEPSVPETPLELMQRAAVHVASTKAWALAKAESVEQRIRDAGGEPNAEMAAAIAAVRAEAQ